MKIGKAIKIIVFVSLILLISSSFGGMVHGEKLERKQTHYGTFEGLKFNNGRIILEIGEDGSVIIKSAKSGKILVERAYPLLEIKRGRKWRDVKFNEVVIKERDWAKWHMVRVKMLHRGKLNIKVILKYVAKHKFRRYKPIYPILKIKINKKVKYRIKWYYKGVNLRRFEIIDNGSGETRTPYRSGHGRQVIYNGTIEGNMTFDKGQDILRGYDNGHLQMGLNWETSKNVYTILKFLEEKHNGRRNLNIIIEPKKGNVWQGSFASYKPPIPDSGGGGKDSDGDGLYDAIEEAGWDITWYDAKGQKHTEHVTSDPDSKDTDGDGLSDYEEWKKGTSPRNADTDGDGLGDYKEAKHLGTSPVKADTDGDGLTDYVEVHGWYVWSESKWVTSNPFTGDTDEDGLSDYEEWKLDTDPRNVDTDGDSILDGFDKYPTIKDDEKPEMSVPHIYASNGKWWIKNLYVEDNANIAKVTIKYYVHGSVKDTWNEYVYASHAWINTSVEDNIWDYIEGNKIEVIVTDVNGNTAKYDYSHDLYSDLANLWDKISKYISGAIKNAVRSLISAYPDLAPLIALAWALGESLWSNTIGGLIDIVKNPKKFIDGIRAFINALQSNGVMNTITAVLDGIKNDIEEKVNALVSYISDSIKRNEVKEKCFDMFVVGEIIGFVVSMAIQPDGFATGLGEFIEKIGSDAGKLAEAFSKIAETIEKMKSLLKDVKSLALGKLMDKSTALKNAVKELVQTGKMGEKTKNLMNRISEWFGKKGVEREEDVVEEATSEVVEGTNPKNVEDALEDMKDGHSGDGSPDRESFREDIEFRNYLDELENDGKLASILGGENELKDYVEKIRNAYDEIMRSSIKDDDKIDFINTIKSGVNAVKNGLVEKNTKSYILNAIRRSGYNPERVYMYAILPRKVLMGDQKVINMLKTVWEKILGEIPLKDGFGRVVHIDEDTTLKELTNAIKSGDKSRAEEIIRNLKNGKYYEFGRGKGIYRVSDIHGQSVGEIMKELKIDGSVDGRAVIELKTGENPRIYDHIWDSPDKDPVHAGWDWPYTSTGFISTKNGEILPEYYLADLLKDSEGQDLPIAGIRLITADGGVYSLGW